MGEILETFGLRRGAETLLRDLIHERTGMYFDNAKLGLMSEKIAPLIVERGFNSFLDYYYLLKFDADAADEWIRVHNNLSVQETYFWREMDQIHALAEHVLPHLVSEKKISPIRIWSSACATGEEPLSIAMRLNEEGWFDRADIQISASDLSSTALDRARRGVYRDRSFRSLPDYLKEKYFEQEGKEWRICRSIHERVTWRQINLLDETEVAPLAGASVIFCRNVFIYFSSETIGKVVETFADNMRVPAYLFAGASESLLKVSDDFELEEVGDCFVYVKHS